MKTKLHRGKNTAAGRMPLDLKDTHPKLSLIPSSDPRLAAVSAKAIIDDAFIDFAADFISTYYYFSRVIGPNVVGLAAPQVGKNIRCFIAYGTFYINPELIHVFDGKDETCYEGCLSLGIHSYFPVSRPYGIILKYQDLTGDYHEKRFNNLNARVMLHELDHLNGILCCGPAVSDSK